MRKDTHASSASPAPQSYFGEIPIVGSVPRMKWDLSDPTFATKLARRRTPVVLTDSPASAAWQGFDKWAEPGYLEHKLPEPINFAKSYDPNFMYYNKRHAWAEEARRIRAAPAQRLGATLSLCSSALASLCVLISAGESLLVMLGPEWGDWVVPSVDIKLTLAGFHREVRWQHAHSCAARAAAGLTTGCTAGELIVGGRAPTTTQHLCERE